MYAIKVLSKKRFFVITRVNLYTFDPQTMPDWKSLNGITEYIMILYLEVLTYLKKKVGEGGIMNRRVRQDIRETHLNTNFPLLADYYNFKTDLGSYFNLTPSSHWQGGSVGITPHHKLMHEEKARK